MTDITWIQLNKNHWRTNAMENGLYGHVVLEKASDGVDEYWAHTYLQDHDIPAGPHEIGEVWIDLESAQKDAEDHLREEWSNVPSF